VNTIALKRKHRIAQEREGKKRERNKKLAVATMAGAIGAFVLFNGKAGACSTNYTVKKGDNLYRLSKKYEVSVEQLMIANGLNSDKVNIGQQLLVPGEIQAPPTGIPVVSFEKTTYIANPGDTLWGISNRFGVKLEDLMKDNKLRQKMVLIGQRLTIPGQHHFSKAEIVGAADNFTVEFDQNGEPLVLKVPYGTASSYQNKSGQKVTVIHKNGAVISVY
jgi:LysM repeat protein